MSHVNSIHHIVINTYMRRHTIDNDHKRELYGYIYGIIKNKKCHLYRMNGISNHIHLLVNLHPDVTLADFVQAIKQSSSRWLKCNGICPNFEGWGKEYFATSKGVDQVDTVVEYIKRQEEHHKSVSFDDELARFFNR